MFYSLRGKLIHTTPTFFVVECGGVGYKCSSTFNTLRELPKIGTETTVYTYLNVREDNIELFGFSSQEELDCYKMLTSVSGVGPRVGIAMLSELSSQQVVVSIATNDSKTLTKAQGVGPKLAQRIVLELKDKIKGLTDNNTVIDMESTTVISNNSNIEKAIGALVGLGFSSADVTPIISKLDQTLTVEQLIAQTLKEKGRR